MANFRKWSSSASGNSSVAGGANTINFAEGQAPGSVNNSAREMMAQIRAIYAPDEWGWVEHSATASIASQTAFKLAGNQTTNWVANRRWRLKSGSTTRYGTVVSSSFTSETTITVTVDSGSLSASHSLAALSSVSGDHVPDNYLVLADLAGYVTSNSLSAGKATSAEYRNNTADKILTTDKVWSAAGSVALTWAAGGTFTADLSAGINFTVTTSAANSTLTVASAKTGQSGFIHITQGATPRSLTFSSAWVFAGGTDPTLTNTGAAVDVLFYQVLDATGPVVFGNLVKNVS
jgi:hypothetical protein